MPAKLCDLCRLCGTDTLSIVRHLIFEEEGLAKCLPNKIAECLPIKVAETDPLPKLVCGECAYKLDLLSEFRNKVVSTEQLLESLASDIKSEVCNDKSDDESIFDGGDCNDYQSDSQDVIEPTVQIKEEPEQEKRPSRKAARKRFVEEIVETEEDSDENYEDDYKPEEDEIKPPPKKRGRKAKGKTKSEKNGKTKRVVSINCTKCETSYANRRALNYHMKTAHHPPLKENEKSGEEKTSIIVKTENGDVDPKSEPATEIKTAADEIKPKEIPEMDQDNEPLVVRGQYDCSKCLRSFICRTSWQKHIEKSHDHLCKTCNRVYTSPRDLQDHCCIYKCKECDKGMKSAKALRNHLKLHNSRRVRFECAHCGACFNTKVSLCSHIRSRGEHTCRDQQLWCMPCGKKFSSGLALRHHTARIHTEGVFLCCKCHTTFNTKEERRAHYQQTHPKKKMQFDCPECGKKLSSRGSVKLHVNTVHKKLKPSLCQVCAKACVNDSQLRVHMTMHTGEKRYVCKVCGHPFARSENLHQHMRIHNDVRPFVCEFCAQGFRQQSSLTIHRRMHTGETPYPCHLCELQFRSRGHLNHHLKNHPAT